MTVFFQVIKELHDLANFLITEKGAAMVLIFELPHRDSDARMKNRTVNEYNKCVNTVNRKLERQSTTQVGRRLGYFGAAFVILY